MIRETCIEDRAALLALYPEVFPEEDLRPLVAALLALGEGCLSLVDVEGGAPVAHVAFTRCGTVRGTNTGALLGPLAVAPGHQRQGRGRAILLSGLERVAAQGVQQVFVLGDPGYYKRFGFRAEKAVATPFPIPEAWAAGWQSLTLPGCAPLPAGTLLVPAAWRDPALWAP
ncbi:MAG: N-acetyltransferase [Pseudomonadota bacterium]